MSVAGRLAVLALRPPAEGALDALGHAAGDDAVAPVSEFLTARFEQPGSAFAEALRNSMERAWKAIEIVLHGGAWLKKVAANAEDRPLADQLGKLVIETEAALAQRESQRRPALAELALARRKHYLNMPPQIADGMQGRLAAGVALYSKFADYDLLLKADRSAVQQIASELRQSGFPNLAAVLILDDGPPLLAVAARYFFRRAIQDDPRLYEAFTFARPEELLPELQEAYDALYDVITLHGRRLEELLGNVAVAAQEKATTLDLQAEAAGPGAAHAELYREVTELLRRFDLTHPGVRHGESNLVRNDHERQQIRKMMQQFHMLPDRAQRLPALLNAIGRLELAAGDSAGALREFQSAAAALSDPAGKGEAHMNAHRAALELPDYNNALKEYLEAVKVDGRRFAGFPVGKYIPTRVLGAGAFGTAFLCKHKFMNAPVVVKTLATEGLDREVDDVFGEAQALVSINHPTIIRVQDCGYADPAQKSRPFLVMDYFDAPTLRQYVEQRGPLSVPELLALVESVAAGLQAAHAKRILHRDIKPDNLLVKRLPDAAGKPSWEVKLIDFGLSLKQPIQSARDSKLVDAVGTAEYAAPEQLGRLPGVDAGPTSDIYSFAKTCCYALFQTTAPLMKHWTSVPKPLAELLERCLSDRPDDRPKDFAVINRCFARLNQPVPTVSMVGPADVPRVAAATALQSAPVPRVAPRVDRVEEYHDYEPEPRGHSGLIVAAILGGLALLFLAICGGGGAAVYYAFGRAGAEKTEAEVVDTGKSDKANDDRGRGDFDRRFGGGKGREDNKRHTITFVGAPNEQVADFVKDRVGAAEGVGKRFDPPHVVSVRKDGNTVVAIVEIQRGDPDDWVRDLDVGTVDREGDDFKVTLTAPPEPLRKVPEPPPLPKLNDAQFKALLASVRRPGDERQVIQIMKTRGPGEGQRATGRQFLRLHIKDPFFDRDAIEALGNWGTGEDTQFLAALDNRDGDEHIIAAVGRIRDSAGASYLCRHLDHWHLGDKACEALRSIAPAAEKEIQGALLNNKHGGAVRAARLLQEFGSTDSVVALRNAGRDKNAELSKAAWQALRTILYFPQKPFAPGPKVPGSTKPKTTSTIDDLKVTELDDAAGGLAPNVCLTADGQGFYTMDAAGAIARREWDGAVSASANAEGAKLMAVSRDGLLVAGAGEAKLLHATKLETKSSGPMDNPLGLTSWPGIDIAIARAEGAVPGILVIDLASFSYATVYADRKAGKALILPPGIGKNDPVLTPDGKLLFTQGEGKLQRWTVASNKISAQDATPKSLGAGDGKIIVSPDGKFVVLFYKGSASTAVYGVNDMKKPAFYVDHGPKAVAFAFDGKGSVYAATETKSLIRFDADGNKTKEHDLGGVTKQIVADADGKRLLILTKDKILKVELP